jgi:hypothetical protein
LELALKTHFQLQQQSHVKKSKKKDVRPLFDGQKITTEGVIEKLKELEKEKQEKQSKKTNRKLSFEDDQIADLKGLNLEQVFFVVKNVETKT